MQSSDLEKVHQFSYFGLNDEGLDDSDGAMEPDPRDIAAPRGAATGDADRQGSLTPPPCHDDNRVFSQATECKAHRQAGGSPDSGGDGLATTR